jgi:hypothetical protein
MNRTFSALTVLAMLLVAVGLCAKQTFDGREAVDPRTVTLLFAVEAVVAGLVVAAAVSLLRKRIARRRKPIGGRRPVPATV